jgi:hypothetical protein
MSKFRVDVIGTNPHATTVPDPKYLRTVSQNHFAKELNFGVLESISTTRPFECANALPKQPPTFPPSLGTGAVIPFNPEYILVTHPTFALSESPFPQSPHPPPPLPCRSTE